MKNMQLLKISVKSIKSELFELKIKNASKNNLKINLKDLHTCVLIDDEYDKVNSFYDKARFSAKIKKEFKKFDIIINDVYFYYDFKKIDEKAYIFFLNNEFSHNFTLIDEKIKKCA